VVISDPATTTNARLTFPLIEFNDERALQKATVDAEADTNFCNKGNRASYHFQLRCAGHLGYHCSFSECWKPNMYQEVFQ